MERSGHRERKEIPLRVVVKMCFYAILLDIFFALFCFLFRIINVLLAGMSRICHRFRNLHESVEIEEVAPEDSPIVEDDSASLRDAHVTDTNPLEMNDGIAGSSSESKGADDIPEGDSEDATTEDIRLEKSPVVEDDFKEDYANLIDVHVTDTSSPKMSDDTTSSSSSESNGVDDIPEKDSENVEKVNDRKISPIVKEDLKEDSANLRDGHHVTDTNPPEIKDSDSS